MSQTFTSKGAEVIKAKFEISQFMVTLIFQFLRSVIL